MPTGRIIAPEKPNRDSPRSENRQTVRPYSGHMPPDEEFVHSEDVVARKKMIG